MEIIHKTVTIPESHTISVTLPKNIAPGEVEMVMILNAKTQVESHSHADSPTSSAVSNSESLKEAALSKLADLLHDNKSTSDNNPEMPDTETAAAIAAPPSESPN